MACYLRLSCHKGSHHSGHYESFRRNHIYPPFSTPEVQPYAQSRTASQEPSAAPSPQIVHAAARMSRRRKHFQLARQPSLSGASATQLTLPSTTVYNPGSRRSSPEHHLAFSKQALSPVSVATADDGPGSLESGCPSPTHTPAPSQDTSHCRSRLSQTERSLVAHLGREDQGM